MRTTTLPLLLLPLLFTGCSPIRTTHAQASDDSPIIIADGGGSSGTLGGRGPKGNITTLSAPPVPYTLIRHDEVTNHRIQFWDGFYIQDNDSGDYQATCFEMPALPAGPNNVPPAYPRVVVPLVGTTWNLLANDGFVLNSGPDASPHNNQNLVSVTAHMPIQVDTQNFIFDPSAPLTKVTLTVIDGQGHTTTTPYPTAAPYPIRSVLAFKIHYCRSGACKDENNNDPCQ